MCLRPLWSKVLREVLDIAQTVQWPLGSKTLKEGWLPMHKNGRQLKSTSASQKGGFTQKIIISILAPHHLKVNFGIVLIHQYYQQIIRWQETLLIFCVNKIEKNATNVRRSRDHKHIGLLMRENLGCQLSNPQLRIIEITCARRVWHTLQKYVMGGCIVNTGQNCTK